MAYLSRDRNYKAAPGGNVCPLLKRAAKGASGHQLPKVQTSGSTRPEPEARLISFPGPPSPGWLQPPLRGRAGQGTHKALPDTQRQHPWLRAAGGPGGAGDGSAQSFQQSSQEHWVGYRVVPKDTRSQLLERCDSLGVLVHTGGPRTE